jgi:hypothetical protein
MTTAEFKPIVQWIVKRWPNTDFEAWAAQGTFDAMLEDLQDLDHEQVQAAVRAHHRKGSPWPPTSGELRQLVVELTLDIPDWAFVWSCAQSLAARGWGGPYHDHASVRVRCGEALEQLHPTVRKFLEGVGAHQVFQALGEGGSGEARLREKFKEWAARSKREGALVGIEPAGLRVLERVNDGPKRPDFARALPGPREAA